MYINDKELKEYLDKYLLLAIKEDIFIVKDGKVVAKLSAPYQDKKQIVESLVGIIPSEMSLEEAKEERLNKIWKFS